MSLGPLDVLRELLDFEERHAEYEPRVNHEGREAIAQVEALADKVDSALTLGWSDTAARELLEALQPFTPGQDSEGGGHG